MRPVLVMATFAAVGWAGLGWAVVGEEWNAAAAFALWAVLLTWFAVDLHLVGRRVYATYEEFLDWRIDVTPARREPAWCEVAVQLAHAVLEDPSREAVWPLVDLLLESRNG